MPGTRGQGRFQKSKLSRARARFHDLNSQRRYRDQSTVTWAEYRKITGDGAKKYKNKGSK